MRRKESVLSKIISWIFFIILVFIIFKLFGIFKMNYFNGFMKGETVSGLSSFTRDSEVKYLDDNSYKIVSEQQNNAAFFKDVEVEPNSVYKVTCYVKTDNVIPEDVNTDGGANIGIMDSYEISKSITGTNDWQQIEMMFNSQNRTSVKIGFRLGGNTGTAEGTAWFSNFKMEKGIANDSNVWNVGCFIFKSIDVNTDGERKTFNMTMSDIQDINNDIRRYQKACETLSDGKMKVEYDVHEINDTITTISYSDEFGYYIDPYDVNQYIEDTVEKNEYDYIFAVIRMGNNNDAIMVKNWMGLRKYGFIWYRIFKHKNAK